MNNTTPETESKTPRTAAAVIYLQRPSDGEPEPYVPVMTSVQLETELAEAKAKLDFLKSKGMSVGLMSSSDKPEPYLAYVIEPDSELCDLKTIHKLIDTEQALAAERAAHNQTKVEWEKIYNAKDEDLEKAEAELEKERAAHEETKRDLAEARVWFSNDERDQLRARVAELEKERDGKERQLRLVGFYGDDRGHEEARALFAERDQLRARVQELEKHIPERVRRHNLPL